jgi:aspartate/methionine/tyrosine aminotransferase
MFSDRTCWNREQNRLSRTLAELRAAGVPILDLTRSNPTECGLLSDESLVRQAVAQPGLVYYQPDPKGLLEARVVVSQYYNHLGARLSPEDVILTSGTSEGYSFVFRLLCNPGDEVLIPSPGYPLFDFLADLSDVRLVRFPLLYDHGWQIDFHALEELATERARAVVVIHPNNPTGHYVSATEQDQLARFCQKRGLALVADEVFLDFSLPARRQLSFVRLNEALAFTLSGLSKICGMPQMKLAWVAVSGPEPEKGEALARLEVIADAFLSVGTPAQLAARTLFDMRHAFHAQAMQRIGANLEVLDDELSRQRLCARLAYEGGWTAVLRVPALESDEELAIALLKERAVHAYPGHFYDFRQPGHLIVSLIVPPADFAQGLRRILAHFGADPAD